MTAPANHWKLGLFVVVSVLLGLGALLVLGARSMHDETINYTTFFDESVQGLDVGSPVKFRGVTIGNVSRINIADDRRHVEVGCDLIVSEITRLGLGVDKGQATKIAIPEDLRMQLASAGITGVKFMQIDFFPVADNPPPELPFAVPDRYIPAAVSVMKNIEDSIVRAVNRIPEATEQALLIMKKIGALLDQVEERKMPEQAEGALIRANTVLARLDSTLAELELDELSLNAVESLANINVVALKLNVLIDRVGAKDGVYQSVERASNALGDVARGSGGLGVEMQQTLRSVQDAATSIQRLTDALELDSDMLLKGRKRRTN
jgi:phospholipid/cholesterol/gamma-HCH transport system substrate-binding protein